MRLERLDLIRYGKFTDRTLALPAAEHDFHVIVGPNEAGKSTIRAAIQDLFYGIALRTTHGFLHAMSDLRLGARISQGADQLEFLRTKGNKQTLRNQADAALPDNALLPYLGTTDRAFFRQMFGLDHERLVAGGTSILEARNDLGQILFQSAAGITGLGAAREALDAEADKLWAKRRSGDRLYYIAADEFEQATAALKDATVRTKAWTEAHERVTELEAAQAHARQELATVKQRRSTLERVRRVGRYLHARANIHTRLADLQAAPELPENAAQLLSDAEMAMATAQVDITHYQAQLDAAVVALEGTVVDADVRAREAEISQLNALRVQYDTYATALPQRHAEINAQWKIAAGLATELGWDSSAEAAVAARLPSLAARATLARLARAHAPLQQAQNAAARAERQKNLEITQAAAEQHPLTAADAPAALQAALSKARKLGDVDATLRERQQQISTRQAALNKAYIGLGDWPADLPTLQAMRIPEAVLIQQFVQAQQLDETQAQTLADTAQKLERRIEAGELEIQLYRKTRHPAMLQDVEQARQIRDVTWASFKENPAALASHGSSYEQQVVAADRLADQRHDTAHQASELASKQAEIARQMLELKTSRDALNAVQAGIAQRAAQWAALITQRGLVDLPFQSATHWLQKREEVLQAEAGLDQAKQALVELEALIAEASARLSDELVKVGQPGAEALDVLMLNAGDYITHVASQKGHRAALEKQLADARRDIALLAADTTAATTALSDWNAMWAAALVQAQMTAEPTAEVVEGVLVTMEKIDTLLAAINATRVGQIDKMRADIAEFDQAVNTLVEVLAPDMAGGKTSDIVLALVARLEAANASFREAARLREARDLAQIKYSEATLKHSQARAVLDPLFQHAGVALNEELRAAIGQSSLVRELRAELAAADKAISESGDGLSVDALSAEVASADSASLATELDQLADQDSDLVTRLTTLAAQLPEATRVLAAIAGSAEAAKAEAQRQEALARMADAAERYVKVYTAARLLKWSIDQYREAQQGPMLTTASSIFARLTLGSFSKLAVDFETDPPRLQGRRANGTPVDIAGMSEGTRDQLYLALRLAALGVHLDQAPTLPFIADDLFINYDDQRSRAGLEALRDLSRKTQVVFLTHHDHLLPLVRDVFGAGVDVHDLTQ